MIVNRKHLVLFVLCAHFSFPLIFNNPVILFCFFFFAKPTTTISVFTSVIRWHPTGFAYCFPFSHLILLQQRQRMLKNMSHIFSSHRTCLNAKIKKKKRTEGRCVGKTIFFPLLKSNLASDLPIGSASL